MPKEFVIFVLQIGFFFVRRPFRWLTNQDKMLSVAENVKFILLFFAPFIQFLFSTDEPIYTAFVLVSLVWIAGAVMEIVCRLPNFREDAVLDGADKSKSTPYTLLLLLSLVTFGAVFVLGLRLLELK